MLVIEASLRRLYIQAITAATDMLPTAVAATARNNKRRFCLNELQSNIFHVRQLSPNSQAVICISFSRSNSGMIRWLDGEYARSASLVSKTRTKNAAEKPKKQGFRKPKTAIHFASSLTRSRSTTKAERKSSYNHIVSPKSYC